MAGDKKFTQEQVDKAVAKAVKAETKRCLSAVKGAVEDCSDTSFDNAADKVMFVKGVRATAKAVTTNIKDAEYPAVV